MARVGYIDLYIIQPNGLAMMFCFSYLDEMQQNIAEPLDRNSIKIKRSQNSLSCNPYWHEGGHFYIFVLFGSDFVSWIFITIFQSLWRQKLTSIGLIWHPAKLIESYKKCYAKDEHSSCFHSSCQWGLNHHQFPTNLCFCPNVVISQVDCFIIRFAFCSTFTFFCRT